MNPLLIGGVITAVADVADDLFTSDEERLKLALAEKEIDAGLMRGQLDVNQAEAGNASLFVAGWRPAVGWVCVASLAYQFILYPLLVWGWAWMQAKGWISLGLIAPPLLDAEALWVLLTGMLGIAGLRSVDKFKAGGKG